MTRILVAPVDAHISNREYGKSYNILNNLGESKVRVDAYVGEELTPIEAENVHVHEFHTRNRLKYYGKSFQKVARELRSGTVDVYHHMNLSYRWFNPVLLAGVGSDIPTVVGPCQAGHEIFAEEFNLIFSKAFGVDTPRTLSDPLYDAFNATRDSMIDPVRMALFQRTLEAADRIIVVHEDAKDTYAKYVDETKIDVIPLGVDPDIFEFRPRKETHDLVAIGRLKRRKGYDVLFKALPKVIESFPDTHLHVFGEGPAEPTLKGLARELGVNNHITFHGYVEQSVVREYLERARAFVHPSRSESFSLVRLEAMAVGCPVVVTDVSGAKEMVNDGDVGFVVPTESPGAIAEAVLKLISDFDLATAMGERARERIEVKYDWRDIGSQYLDVYNSIH
ncbi:glycosyltransferase [Salinibaculum salinum]|uniref:glycosyltransferase n=1 Tax=Salinibaculum salinum TaxID=3131996 RepID=UPI0030EBB624